MARLNEKEYTYFTTVRGMCGTCGKTVPARVFFRDGGVWQETLCPDCSGFPAAIAADQQWYGEQVLRRFADHSPLPGAHAPKAGCPRDCGPCAWHASPCVVAIVELDTFGGAAGLQRALKTLHANKNAAEQLLATGDEAVAAEVIDILNTCPVKDVAVACNAEQVCTDSALAGTVADAGIGVNLTVNDCLRTAEALEQLSQKNLPVVLYLDLDPENADALPAVFDLLNRFKNVSGIELEIREIPIDTVLHTICEASGGSFSPADFAAADGAHSLCRQGAIIGEQKVTVHSLMRPETFDCARAMLCPVCVLTFEGLVPRCVYDLLRRGRR